MASSRVTIVKEADFEAEVLKSDKMVLIDFYTNWSGPCKTLSPTLEKFAEDHPEVKVVKIDVDQSSSLARRLGISNVPTLVTAKDGKFIIGTVGVLPKEGLEVLIRETISRLTPPPPPPTATNNYQPALKGPSLN